MILEPEIQDLMTPRIDLLDTTMPFRQSAATRIASSIVSDVAVGDLSVGGIDLPNRKKEKKTVGFDPLNCHQHLARDLLQVLPYCRKAISFPPLNHDK
jgi:hypothetical protein